MKPSPTDTLNLKEIVTFREKIDRLKKEADKAEGASEQLEKEMRAEFGVKTIEEARKLLEEREETDRKMERLLQKEMTKFNEKWEGKINENSSRD